MAPLKLQNQELFIKGNGGMGSLMELVNYSSKMVRTSMAHLQMDLFMAKGDSYLQPNLIMRAKLGTIWLKERESI